MINFKAAMLAAAGALGLVGAGVAGAQDADVPKVTVRYAAATLESESGARQVYRRIEAAAEEVCGGARPKVLPNTAVLECRKQAVAGAVAYIHNTRLAALASSNKVG